MKKIKDRISNYKPLKEYTLEELYGFLKNNENITTDILACICSEILRRQLEKELKDIS